jgi:hypothetical protein
LAAIVLIGVDHDVADKTLQRRMWLVEAANHGFVWKQKVHFFREQYNPAGRSSFSKWMLCSLPAPLQHNG